MVLEFFLFWLNFRFFGVTTRSADLEFIREFAHIVFVWLVLFAIVWPELCFLSHEDSLFNEFLIIRVVR